MNKRPLAPCFIIAAVLIAWAPAAFGFVVARTGSAIIKWPAASASFYANLAGAPAGAQPALQSALNAWSNVATADFSFVYRGQTTAAGYGLNDGVNLFCFGFLDYDTIALNTYWFDSETGALQDSDIKFNTQHSWGTDGSPGAMDIQTLALHELGHALSLEDLGSGDEDKVMYGYCSEGILKRDLHQDDRDGISYIYPSGSAPTTTTSAPGGTTTSIYIPPEECPAMRALGQDRGDLALLRCFRDDVLARSEMGRKAIRAYYRHAPELDKAFDRSPWLRELAGKILSAAAHLMMDCQ